METKPQHKNGYSSSTLLENEIGITYLDRDKHAYSLIYQTELSQAHRTSYPDGHISRDFICVFL